MRARLDCVYPRPFVGVADIFVYLVVEHVYVWVGGGVGTESITLADEYNDIRQIYNDIRIILVLSHLQDI